MPRSCGPAPFDKGGHRGFVGVGSEALQLIFIRCIVPTRTRKYCGQNRSWFDESPRAVLATLSSSSLTVHPELRRRTNGVFPHGLAVRNLSELNTRNSGAIDHRREQFSVLS